jgi:AcrR family transcriptional regulator
MTAMPRQSDTRRCLLDAFAQELLDAGYTGASLDRIARSVGIRKASLYHHFPGGKEQLCVEVSLRYIEHSRVWLQGALATEGPLPAVLEAIVVGRATEGARLAIMGQRVFDATRHLSAQDRAEVSGEYCEALIAPVTELMARAVAEGVLRGEDPSFLASAFLVLSSVAEPLPLDHAMPPELREDPPADPRALARSVVALFLRGAGTRPT